MRRLRTRSALAAVLALGGLILPASAAAKVTCASPLDAKSRVLTGMPRSPVAGVVYETSIRTKARYPVNPKPILMLVRCVGEEERQFMQVTPDREGPVRSDFTVELRRAGHWIGALMDRQGRFFNLGPWDVAASASRTAGGRFAGLTAFGAIAAG